MFMNVPGLKIVAATTPADVKGLLKSAIRDNDPVLFFEDSKLWALKDDVSSDPELLVPMGKGDIKHAGDDVTVVAILGTVRLAIEAAKQLAAEGITVEVVDPRTLKPLDMELILRSVAKTGRLIVVENAHRMVSAGAEISATVVEEAFDSLKKPIIRLATPDTHVGYSPVLEEGLYPTKDDIIAAVRKLL